MNETLAKEILKYIEHVEVKIEEEFGEGRSLDQLIEDDEMPNIWHELRLLSGY
jgi:hypothetical protein